MRSITAKAILTLLVTALFVGGICWAASIPWMSHPDDATLPSSSTVHSHLFSPEWASDDVNHWHECPCGEKTSLASHLDVDFNEECDICSANVPHEHRFGTLWLSDDANHWNECPCGEKTSLAPHLDTDYNEECDICSANIPHEHSFGASWLSDDANHWNECPCGEKTNLAPHLDADFNEECDICSANVPHEHSFGTSWLSDENTHWQVCGCGEKTSPSPHLDKDFDENCDVCGTNVPHEHSFGTPWLTDDANHWHECACGKKTDLASHLDSDFNEKCDICSAVVPHEHSFGTSWLSDENAHWQVCDCGERSASTAHTNTDGNYLCDVCNYIVVRPSSLSASSAFIYDCQDDSYFFKNQALDTAIYPASITKLFTAYVALQHLNLTDTVVLGDEQSFFPYDASTAGFNPGDIVTVEALLHGLLMKSGSDCAYALAAATGRKIRGSDTLDATSAIAAFIQKMNKTAQTLDMGDTHFTTPDGIHVEGHHYISFHAFVTIAKCAMENETILEICGKQTATVYYTDASGLSRHKSFTNTNALINPDSSYYIPQAIGLKTGYTDAAGNCFLGLFLHEGEYVIIGVFGCPSGSKRWQDMKTLWNYYLELESQIRNDT